MGLPMAVNLTKAYPDLQGQDISEDILEKAKLAGIAITDNPVQSVQLADCIFTMLPAGNHVKKVMEDLIFPHARQGTLIIDCSTIDVATSRELAQRASSLGLLMVDAPVSGGVGGATQASLTLMVGGSKEAFEKSSPFLQQVGKKIIHCGDSGAGQGVKICNNMMLGIQMISVCEAFALAHKLNLDPAKLFEVSSNASGQCWSLTSYCPEPGLVATAPSNRDYMPGFSVAMMLKDLKLAAEASDLLKGSTPLGHHAMRLYQEFLETGNANLDFSGIIQKFNEI